MKKILFFFIFLLAPWVTFAAGANKMTMVTYFPVKYVAYSQVDVTKQMDVGLTSVCQMNLGCSADDGFSTGKSLQVNTALNVAKGKLDLNDAPAIVGNTAFIGSGNGTADFDFETNLRVNNYKQGYTLQTDNMYLSELNLFGYKFPACSGSTMSWQKLKLKNTEEVYLACGEAEKVTCTPTNNGKSTYTENCPSGQTGQITYTWNTVACKYDETANTCQTVQTCSDSTYKASHKSECCPSAPKTDTVCYKYGWVTVNSYEDFWFPSRDNGYSECLPPQWGLSERGCTDVPCSKEGSTCSALVQYGFWNVGDTDCVGLIEDMECQRVKNGW